MTEKHYDAVVLGTSVGALVAAALLARRGFRVLVLGQGGKPPSYRFGSHVLRRSARTLLFASSPVFRRVLAELAQSQTFRRRAFSLDPMVGLVFPDRRFELPPDRALFEREIEREFPEERRAIGELYAELARINAAADAAFEQDLVLPPGTFWERRRAARMLVHAPDLRDIDEADLFADLPEAHDYRRIVLELARFAADGVFSNSAASAPALRLAAESDALEALDPRRAFTSSHYESDRSPSADIEGSWREEIDPPDDEHARRETRGRADDDVLATNRSSGRELSPFALARLHGAWTRGVVALPGGEDDLVDFLVDRILAYGGTCRFGDRAARISVGRAGALAVTIDGDAAPTGATFLLFDGTGEKLVELSEGEGLLKRAAREWPRVAPFRGRFVMSMVVRSAGLPAGLARESLLLARPPDSPAGPRASPWDAIHLVRMDGDTEAAQGSGSGLRAGAGGGTGDGGRISLLVAEALVPLGGVGAATVLASAREHVLAAVDRAFPFLGRHLEVVDSPHDGRPLWIYERGIRRDVDRVHLPRGSLGAEPMAAQYLVESPGFLGLSGEPLRGPIARTFLVGGTVLPGLGQEGRVLAAVGAALLVTRSDRHKERIRRAMWSRIEIG